MSGPRIVGISGATEHGKDEISKIWVSTYGYTRYGFSEEMKKELRDRLRRTLKSITIWDELNLQLKNLPDHLRWHGDVALDESWWDERLHYILWNERTPTIRALQQEYGMLRRKDDEHYWVRKWMIAVSKLDLQLIVVPDVRMWVEAKYLREAGARLFKVERPGHTAAGVKGLHEDPTERNLDLWTDWDHVFVNNGTIEDLNQKVVDWVHG
jgi:hypothetical protein